MSSVETTPTHILDPRLLPTGFEIRMAEISDIPAIMPLAKEFFDQTQFKYFGVEFSKTNGEQYLAMIIEHSLTPLLLATVDDKVVGWVTFSYDVSFFKHPIAVLNTIYVTKKYRRTVIGRMLVSAALEMAKEDKACAFYAPVNSGTSSVESLGNMLSKAGMVLSGTIYSRGL